MARLITLTGASGSGKSSAIRAFLEKEDAVFRPETIPKFTTRKPREDDNLDEVKCVKTLPKKLDLIYQQYDVRYGLAANQLSSALDQGRSPIVVLNDVRTISEVKALFGDLVLSIYVFRSAPSRRSFEDVAKARGQKVEDNLDLEKRLKKAEAIYRIYIENIHLFSRVLLNTRGYQELDLQVSKISRSISEQDRLSQVSGFSIE